MAYYDLRSFLTTLEDEGQLLRVTDEVMPEPDVAAAANAACRMGGRALALYFNNVKGFTSRADQAGGTRYRDDGLVTSSSRVCQSFLEP